MFASPTAIRSRLPILGRPGKWFFLEAVALAIVGAGAAWYFLSYVPAHAATESTLQTASVRQGELTLSATGSGTLTAPQEQLGFTANGDLKVTAVSVKAGDLVQAGDLLAEVDSQSAQQEYGDARQKYEQLTGASALADAARAQADAQQALQSAQSQVEYLISPDVMYWEGEVASAEVVVQKAQARLEKSPSDALTRQNYKEAKDRLGFMQEKLAEAWKKYWKEYVPATFPIAIDGDIDTYYAPTDLELEQARQAITDAKATVEESKELYDVLSGAGTMPADTDNASLIGIKQARSAMEKAKARLDGTKIAAPFAGTIMQVNIAGGDTAALNSTETDVVDASNAIVIADTSDPYLEVYWNESDWSLVKVGTAVEITFDDLHDKVFTGKITEVDSQLYNSNGSQVVRGEVSLDSAYSDLNLPVGATASVVVVAQRAENAIYIPVEALHDLGSSEYAVFVITNGEPQVRTVQIGIQTSSYVQVTSGLAAGDVVTTGITKTK